MTPALAALVAALLADLAEDPVETDLRPVLAEIVSQFPVHARSTATTLRESLLFDVRPNIPVRALADWVCDQIVAILCCLCIGVFPEDSPPPPGLEHHSLSRMDADRPFPIPDLSERERAVLSYVPWMAREYLRRLSRVPYPVTVQTLRLGSGNTYAHGGPPLDGIEDPAMDMIENMRFISRYARTMKVDLGPLDYVTARERARASFRFSPGVGRGDPVSDPAWAENRYDLSFDRFAAPVPRSSLPEVAASLGFDPIPVVIGRSHGHALYAADGRPVAFVEVIDWFGSKLVRKTWPSDLSDEDLRWFGLYLGDVAGVTPSDAMRAALEAPVAFEPPRMEKRMMARDHTIGDVPTTVYDAVNELIRSIDGGSRSLPRGVLFLGSGTMRTAYRIGDFVVKIAKPDHTSSNLHEEAVWSMAPPSMRRFMVPTLDVDTEDGRWLIMPLAADDVSESEADRFCKEIRRKFGEEVFPDCWSGNVRRYRGELRLVDYADASPESCPDGDAPA